jgi:hypothetical protein
MESGGVEGKIFKCETPALPLAPCIVCRGHNRFLVKTFRAHLIKNGRDPRMRVWRGLENRDSSDDDWEEEFWRPGTGDPVIMDARVDTREMVNDAFKSNDNMANIEDRVQEETYMAFTTADTVHDECTRSSGTTDEDAMDYGAGKEAGDVDTADGGEDAEFNLGVLEEAMTVLYDGARCTKLAATILLQNLCIVHGVSNSFADEMFSLLHGLILPENNCLPKNHYAVKSLTQKLGLAYNTIHACERGCVLFRGALADAKKCPRCDQPRYKDVERKKFPVKVLRHFPLIPRLQRMFEARQFRNLCCGIQRTVAVKKAVTIL